MSQVTIVSNRLPISVRKTDGELEFYPSVGGLATSLASYTKDKKNNWVGWPGIVSEELTDEDKETIGSELIKHNCYPVFLSQKQVDGFYNGYSNEVLWPLFHNMPSGLQNLTHDWNIYRQVNRLFAEVVTGLSTPESTIWVHDYQLLLVPEMLRLERPYDLIGFFLHIPFPTTAVFKKLPQAKSLLKGMVGADLIGFHTDTYVQDFLESTQQFHVGTPAPGQVIFDDRVVRVTDFPLGIDYAKFSQAGKQSPVQKQVKANRKKYGKRKKIILTVDRLDPTKGLVERLMAYQELLRNNRRLRKKVVMVMLAIPTRSDIKAYRRLKTKVEQLVEDINTTYGKRRWQPVHYMYKTVPFEELAALYRVADIAFIAPIKDGMNLVAKEYVASRPDKQGVLILSETAGAAQELSDALLVNPKRPKSLVEGLSSALAMRPKELKRRLADMQKQLAANTIHNWKSEFMTSLRSSNIQLEQPTKHLAGFELDKLLHDFTQAEQPTLLLDYDGVLTAFTNKPSEAKPTPQLLALLKKLTKRAKGSVLIISGRSREDLEPWLANRELTLAAEHGALMKSGSAPWRRIVDIPTGWKKTILPILQKYADKTPGAFVEEKESSLVWHYRGASPFYAQKYSTILTRILKPLLHPRGLNLYRGNMILEIKSPDANKGVATSHWLKKKHDFILAIGDDYTDEDMFAALPDDAYTVKVGRGKTLAHFRLNTVEETAQFLERLARA
ncbi:MAG TPA: bifunctional alpha,alpha-trehalose-phosphate synthase (UDP-forming)/trehalose-phosphatase [Candidatus Saccharimonadales bacterium]|nr:bifunctional alpha,alpha-trehalose-phosphate synthase (UDP-forming)/trehalose-phosphatase [Candidatus Saccharimonadales bacterium]